MTGHETPDHPGCDSSSSPSTCPPAAQCPNPARPRPHRSTTSVTVRAKSAKSHPTASAHLDPSRREDGRRQARMNALPSPGLDTSGRIDMSGKPVAFYPVSRGTDKPEPTKQAVRRYKAGPKTADAPGRPPKPRSDRLHVGSAQLGAALGLTGLKTKSCRSSRSRRRRLPRFFCSRSAVASGLASRCWMTRLSGRAP